MGSKPGSNNGGGPPKKPSCVNGHDLEKHGKQMWKIRPDGTRIKNGRECMACKRSPEAKARDNERHKQRYREKLIEQALVELAQESEQTP